MFPQAGLSSDHIHFTYAGIRPLPFQADGPESAITRKHIIKRHTGEAEGVISIIGGKLTTYRNLAEQVVDLLCKLNSGSRERCATRDARLPGAVDIEEIAGALDQLDALSEAGRQRVKAIYGGRVRRLVELIDADAELGRALDPDGTVLAAEVALAIREEGALTLTDIVHRRLMVGLSANLGAKRALAIATVAASELGWDGPEAERQLSALNAHNAHLRRAD